MGGIPSPCAGCGDLACSCCIANSTDIQVGSGTGNPGDCTNLLLVPGRVSELVCTEATPGGLMVSGAEVLVCDPGGLETQIYQSACDELNALPAAVGPMDPFDEVVVFDGADCVRKTIAANSCAPATDPGTGACLLTDLAEVWCEGGQLRTYPLPQPFVTTETEPGWTVDLAAATTGVPIIIGTSGVAVSPNPNCMYLMNVLTNGNPGHVAYVGDPGVWFSVLIEESVNAGPFTGIHTVFADYRGLGAGGVADSHTLPSWSRIYGVGISATLSYQWRFVVTLLSAPPATGVLNNFSSHCTFMGIPAP